LAIPSVIIGWLTIGQVLFGELLRGRDRQSRRQNTARDRRRGVHGRGPSSCTASPVPLSGSPQPARPRVVLVSEAPPTFRRALLTQFSLLHRVLMNKYYFDWFNENVIARATRALGFGSGRSAIKR
jgi:NADH-quinone oxidoreductase subunit L